MRPIGLSVYLTEGMGLPDDQIAADRAKLDALRGPVLIVRSPAFAGVEGRISPSGELTLIGTYREPHALPDFEPLVSEAAHGPASGTEAPSSGGGAAGRGRGSSTVLLAIAAIVILLLLLVFLLG